MCKPGDYKNKLFSVLGDSISTLEGYSEPEYAAFYDTTHKLISGVLMPRDTWWGQVIEHLGGKLLVNNSFSGSTVCRHPLYEIQSYACSDERTSSLHKGDVFPDVIMIYMGINDWGHGFRVFRDERFDPVEDNPERFLSAYRQMLKKLKANYPEAEIWCFTLPISRCSSKPNFSFPYYYAGRNISEYCDAIRICAHEFNCREIDLYNKAEPYDTLEGFHPTSDGMRSIAAAIINEISEK
jgi:lysophospholipase L1-like esterase